jgi:hypothetical protein
VVVAVLDIMVVTLMGNQAVLVVEMAIIQDLLELEMLVEMIQDVLLSVKGNLVGILQLIPLELVVVEHHRLV